MPERSLSVLTSKGAGCSAASSLPHLSTANLMKPPLNMSILLLRTMMVRPGCTTSIWSCWRRTLPSDGEERRKGEEEEQEQVVNEQPEPEEEERSDMKKEMKMQEERKQGAERENREERNRIARRKKTWRGERAERSGVVLFRAVRVIQPVSSPTLASAIRILVPSVRTFSTTTLQLTTLRTKLCPIESGCRLSTFET
ncbi:Octapeptide-repeat protein T2 [Balamuthia mandrillaris]